jgi:predicted RNase H-like HicB family nuclease
LDVASQGRTVDEARKNLQEALELFSETASQEELKDRLHNEVNITQMEERQHDLTHYQIFG